MGIKNNNHHEFSSCFLTKLHVISTFELTVCVCFKMSFFSVLHKATLFVNKVYVNYLNYAYLLE